MPFLIRPYRRFPVHCTGVYNTGSFQGQGTLWNFSCSVRHSQMICPCVQGKSSR